jgi:outer membrane protein
MQMKLKWIWLPILLMHLCVFLTARPGAARNKITLRDCIDTAIKNQPTIRAAQAKLEAGKGREKQAFSGYLPQITASTSYSEANQNGGALVEPNQNGGAFADNITKSYNTTLTVNQMLYDFGRTGNAYDLARLNSRSAELEAERVKLDVILNVKQAYFDLLQAQRLVFLSRKTLEQAENHLKQAEAFFRAGSKPIFDVTRAEVEKNSMRLNLINSNNNMRISSIALNNAMGIDPEGQIEIDDILSTPPAVVSFEEVKAEAFKNRPDLQKAESDIEAAVARVRAEEANYFPSLALNGDYNWANGTTEIGTLQWDVKNTWNVDIALSIPLFEGGLTSGKVSEARSNLHLIEAQRDTLRQSIIIDICRFYGDMESAKVRIEVMESSLQKATENFAIAQGRYEEGVGPYIDLSDAQVSSIKAETDYVQSLYDFQIAAARIFNAMGKGE